MAFLFHIQRIPVSRRSAGFTLIEVMIVVVIVAILAAIAMPSYTRYIAKTKRSTAQSYMHSLASRLEQYRLDQRQYTNVVNNVLPPPAEVSANYDITIALAAGSPPGFTINAAPKGTQATADASCGTVKLGNDGTKDRTGTATLSTCW